MIGSHDHKKGAKIMSLAHLCRKLAQHASFILAGVIVSASLLLGHASGQPTSAENRSASGANGAGIAGATELTAGIPSGPQGAETWISCVPVGVVTYRIRVHIHCAAAVGGISYFAVSTTDTAYAARVLSTISTAQVAGRTLSIIYDPADLSGASIGCQTNDCRLILGVGFGQ
jgi:hypothetical protein